jgi:hypothetical protein
MILLAIINSTSIQSLVTDDVNPNEKKSDAPALSIKSIVAEKLTLEKNPIRLYNLDKEKVVSAKIRYLWQSSVNKDKKLPQNVFDYKLFQINDEHIVIYKVDQSLTSYSEKTVNSSNYLMTIKLENIDLLCNEHYFLCTLGEFRREYANKLKNINWTTDPRIAEAYPDVIANTNCVVITIGLFKSLSEIGYLCFEDKQDTYFFLDLISERVLKRYKVDYDGALRLVNQDGKNSVCLGALQDGILKLSNDKLIFTNGKPEYSKKYQKYLEISYSDVYGYANVLYGFDKLPWKLKPEDKPSEFRCFKFTAKVLDVLTNIYFCVMNERQDWKKEKTLSVSDAAYSNDLWVAQLNYKLHLFNLKASQELMVRTVKDMDCNEHVMEPIKYEYRNNVKYLLIFSTYG